MIPNSFLKQKKTIFICVLNWGLGHATRMIPIIDACIDNGSKVIICSDGQALLFLKKTYPSQSFESLDAYNVKYAKYWNALYLIVQSWKIPYAISKENKTLSILIKKHKPDLILSDNRYGCYSKDIRSILITHQTHLFVNKWYGFLPNAYLNKCLSKFQEIWIPDNEQQTLSGRLSDCKHPNVHFIGPLSRLQKKQAKKTTDLLIILSGIEPQRSLLEKELQALYLEKDYSVKWIRGTSKRVSKHSPKIEVVDLAQSQLVNRWINDSKLVITRCGYSSVMDLVCMKQKAILIPTPGQQEQEYLGSHLDKHPLFTLIKQGEIHKKTKAIIKKLLID